MIYSFTLYLFLFGGNGGVSIAHRAHVVKCYGGIGGVSHDSSYCVSQGTVSLFLDIFSKINH